MRNRCIWGLGALALILSASAVGQEGRLVDLAVEPVGAAPALPPATDSLAEAARRHDFPAFDSMYRTTDRHSVVIFAELHRLWTWAMTDPIGAFYGEETYARYARMFPGYATFIEDFRIVDANGRSFFPTAETRQFLLRQALRESPPVREPAVRVAEVTPPVVQKPAVKRTAVTVPVPVPRFLAVSAARNDVPVSATRNDVPVSATRNDVVASAPPPTPARPPLAARQPAPAPPQSQTRPDLARGIFLIIAGLLGVGTLTLMLQTPATRS